MRPALLQSDDCDCDLTYDICPNCCIELSLDVYHDAEPGADSRPITSADIRVSGGHDGPLCFAGEGPPACQ